MNNITYKVITESIQKENLTEKEKKNIFNKKLLQVILSHEKDNLILETDE